MSEQRWQIRLQLQQQQFTLKLDCSSTARVLGIFGPSGSGKTTCLESIAGLRPPAAGYLACGKYIWFDSKQALSLHPEQRGIGYVPQEHLLFPHLSARQNLQYGTQRSQDAAALLQEVIEVLDLSNLDRPIDQLSGGERQRIALGRALCSGPQALLLDEPLASLDATLRLRILPFLIKMRQRFNIPMLVVSHNPLELQALCDDVIALRNGEVIAQGTPITVFTNSDIYGSASAEGFENLLTGNVREHTAHSTSLALAPGQTGPSLTLLRQNSAIGSPLTISIPANDILIATESIHGLSARNRLPATIQQIQTLAGKVILTAAIKGVQATPLVVELTPDAIEELNLTLGSAVDLIIKSSSIAVYS